MGDRANVFVHDGDNAGVYLYTHWSGSKLPETVRAALTRGSSRWGDDQYLNRIIFAEMTQEADWADTCGYGISAYCGEGGNRIIDVDTSAQTVRLPDASGPVSFADYVK